MRRTEQPPAKQAGFSLLEMVVAIAILGLSLGALYESIGGATRNVRTDERYAYGVELARSLLANSAQIPLRGISTQGETEGEFQWRVESQPLNFDNSPLQPGQLQRIRVVVRWADGSRTREVVLDSVAEGRRW